MSATKLLEDALEQAQQSPPPVRACARLHVARAMIAFDRDRSRALLIEGIDELDRITAQPLRSLGR